MDHESVIDKPICLNLNSSWQALGWITTKQAIVAMTGGLGDTPPALAFDIKVDEDGNLIHAVPTKWEDWIKLPVDSSHLTILTKMGAIRAPTVVVRPSFGKMPQIQKKLTKQAIRERDENRCGYSGEVVGPGEGNVDHIIPRDRGGKDSWENLIWCKKEINSKKGNKLNSEAGLNLLKQPKAPRPIPKSATIKSPRHFHHKPFMK